MSLFGLVHLIKLTRLSLFTWTLNVQKGYKNMVNDKKIQNEQVNSTSKKNEVSDLPEQRDDATVQLSSDEYDKILSQQYDNLMKRYVNLENSLLMPFLEKYQIREKIPRNAINFNSPEDIETSLLNYCEKNNISYSKIDDDEIKVSDANVSARAKKYFLL